MSDEEIKKFKTQEMPVADACNQYVEFNEMKYVPPLHERTLIEFLMSLFFFEK